MKLQGNIGSTQFSYRLLKSIKSSLPCSIHLPVPRSAKMRAQKVHGARVRLNAGKHHLFGLANKLVERLAHFRTLDEICEHLPSNSSKVFGFTWWQVFSDNLYAFHRWTDMRSLHCWGNLISARPSLYHTLETLGMPRISWRANIFGAGCYLQSNFTYLRQWEKPCCKMKPSSRCRAQHMISTSSKTSAL